MTLYGMFAISTGTGIKRIRLPDEPDKIVIPLFTSVHTLEAFIQSTDVQATGIKQIYNPTLWLRAVKQMSSLSDEFCCIVIDPKVVGDKIIYTPFIESQGEA